MFESNATCLPSGENAPAITPCCGVVVLVTTLPCPQSEACPELATLLRNWINPNVPGRPF